MSVAALIDFGFALLLNAVLLLGLAVVFDLAMARQRPRLPNVLAGVLIGLMGILLIKVSATLLPGVIFDTRSILLAISGLFLGPVPTLIGMAMTAAYRWSLGGIAMPMGVTVILASGAFGLLWHYVHPGGREQIGWRSLYLLGLLVHLAMLAFTLLMPWDTAMTVLRAISLPVLLIYPLITVALGLFFADRLRRRRDEAALHDSERRFREIYDNVGDAIFVHDPDSGRVLDVNRRACEMYGYTHEEALALDVTTLSANVPPYTAVEIGQAITTARTRGEHTFEWQARTREGRLFWVEVSLRHTQIAGQPRILAMVRDISYRRTAETALQESESERLRAQQEALQQQREARLAALNLMEDAITARSELEHSLARLGERETFIKSVLDNLPIGIAVNSVDPEVHFGYMNDHFPRIYRTTRERIADPDTFWEAVYEDEEFRTTIRRRVLADCASGDPARMHWDDIPVARRGESTFYISARNIPLPERGLVISMVWDVTERKRAENEVRKLSLAIEQSPESIIITNTAPEIEYVNDAFLRVSGFARADVLGQNPRILSSGNTPPETYVALWNSLTRGETWKGEFINQRRDGTEYTEFAIVSPLRQPDGTITHFVAVKEDITEKKHIGAELDAHRHHLEQLVTERTAELEAARLHAETASRAKTSFLANMSHEIRTPLNAIVGLSHLIRQRLTDADQRDRAEKIVRASHHLLDLINDILDLSKIEAGRFELQVGTLDLPGLLDEVAALMADRAQERGLELIVDIDPALGAAPPLRGDATRLRQILLNYMGNAIKFTEHGTVTLRAESAAHDADGLLLRFVVEDTGIGIAPADQARLFQPFEQIDASITRRFGGTGLGLAINKHLVELMGGEVGVDSTPGVGSQFWMTVRLAVSDDATAAGTLPAPAGQRVLPQGLRVLLVEDNPINQEVAHDQLVDAGLTVDVANDGAQAVEMARACAYDAILMDIHMPTMNGLDATRAIRALPDRQATPILAMTASAFEEDRQACQAAGMNDFIAKPFQPELLFNALRRWLGVPVAPALPAMSGDEALPDIEGLDCAAGLANLGNRRARYRAMLKRFAQTHAEDGARLRTLLAAENRSEARRHAHTLKGVAATLGATAVAAAAATLESALRQPATLTTTLIARTDALATTLDALVAALRSFDAAQSPAPAPDDAITPTEADALLAELEALLAQDSPTANHLFAASRERLRRLAGADFAELKHDIDNYDYPRALARVRALRESP